MLDDITKRKINSLRQILVGKVPDPKSQVDQITNALIYKYMDDMDRQAEAFGGKAAFFVGEYEKYSWRKLMDPKLGGQERMNLYVEALEKMGENKNLSPVFRQILRGAFIPYRSPETLNLFLTEINSFAYEHSEELGNAYEYLLSIMGSQGDAGQFRTPRHIIDFIVDVVDPQKGDTILDPACGTAGFLISAYKHILGEHDGKDNTTGKPTNKEERLTPAEMRGIHKNFVGYDISPEMGKLSRVNMFLHSFPEPKIHEYDTLSSDDRWDEKFDVILANPPFMSPKGGIIPHKKFGIPATRAEVLFVDYIMEHLRPHGRAGIIVPEGIIFQSGSSYKQLRKKLVDDGLFAVVSLPSGVFNPYSGVKTSILLFDMEMGKQRKEILFVKIENDGFDLGAQRRPIDKNDLPEAAEVLMAWRKGKKKESAIAHWVKREVISETGDHNLSGDRFASASRGVKITGAWPMVRLKEICEIQNGFAFDSSLFNELRGFPLIRIRDIKKNFTRTKYDGDDFDIDLVVKNGDLLVGMDGEFNAVIWNGGDALLNQRVCRIRRFNGAIDKYVYWMIQEKLNEIEEKTYAVTVKHISSKQIQDIEIPLPSLEIQKQIVAELDGYQNIISGAKQIVQNWKPKIDIDPEWEKVKLGDVCEKLFAGGDVPNGNYSLEKNEDHQVPIYTNGINEKSLYGFTNIAKVDKESVTISARGTIGYSEVRVAPFYPAVRLIVAVPDLEKINAYFLKYSLDGLDIYRNGNSIPQLTIPMISNEEILLPPLEVQKQIVEKIEAERALVESNKKLIEIYEQKMKETIAKLWSK